MMCMYCGCYVVYVFGCYRVLCCVCVGDASQAVPLCVHHIPIALTFGSIGQTQTSVKGSLLDRYVMMYITSHKGSLLDRYVMMYITY